MSQQTLPTTSEFKLAPAPVGKKKQSISLPPMSANPIYDGPMYDSPGGDSLKSLLGDTICSVPSTPLGFTKPLESCTHGPTTSAGDSHYFDMPPSLPPPRKAACKPHPQTPGIPEEPEPTCNGQETVELATSQSINIPPALYEVLEGDHTIQMKDLPF